MLCACASPPVDSQRIQEILNHGVDWNVFFPLAIEHGVSGLIAARLQQLNYETVPQEWREKLQSRMRAQHLFTLSMTAELFRILDAFSKPHIETLLVKGPIVSLLAYGDPAVRGYVDLDLLVCHEDILSATQQMLALGFEPAFPLAAIHA
ncbi:MAG TPA: nucleotidyltransferase family protein, partial [Candidatus Acidoferrum sp.]